MSETSFSVVGEKCGVASPPDTSVSSTSCVDNRPVRRSTLLTGSTENLLTHDVCVKAPCDTEESEVTSSSEIVSKLWNVFPSSFDAVYSDVSSLQSIMLLEICGMVTSFNSVPCRSLCILNVFSPSQVFNVSF